jgi:hypothetical protein
MISAVTAIFGWTAALSLIVSLVLTFCGFKARATNAMSVFSLMLWIAHSAEQQKSPTPNRARAVRSSIAVTPGASPCSSPF